MIRINLYDYDDNSTHVLEMDSIEEVIKTYELTPEESKDFIKGCKVNPKDTDILIHLVYVAAKEF